MASSSSGTSTGTSTGTSWGGSQSDPVIPGWSQELSQMIAALAQSLGNWADQQYGTGQAVTSQTIQNLYEQQGQAAGFANQLMRQYQDIFAPLLNQFASKAQSWASEARRYFNMGQAESTAAQADQAGMETLKRKLEREGVNTSSGAMAEIMRKSAMDDARNRTMAGTQASMQTEQMGNQMMQIAAQMGQNIPGQWGMAAAARTQALNAMEQAILGLLNTGVNLKKLPVEAYSAAAQAIKIGQQARANQGSEHGSQQGSQQTGFHGDPAHPGGGGSGRNHGDPNGGQQRSADPRFNQDPKTWDGKSRTPASAVTRSAPWKNILNVPQGPLQDKGEGGIDPETGMPLMPGQTVEQSGLPELDPLNPDNLYNPLVNGTEGEGNAPYDMGPNYDQMGNPDPFATDINPGYGDLGEGARQQEDWRQQDQTQQDLGDNWNSDSWGGGDYGMNQQEDTTASIDQTGWADQQDQNGADWGGQSEDQSQDWSQDESQQQDWGQQDQSQQQDWGQQDQSQQDMSDNWNSESWGGGGEDYSSYDDYGTYAKGGGVLPTTGGHVPRGASPSKGKQTDDIPARLNADEFVIPKDVVKHFGTKHFDRLIAQSRKARTGMAGPKPKAERKAPLPNMNRPTFVSRYTGGR